MTFRARLALFTASTVASALLVFGLLVYVLSVVGGNGQEVHDLTLRAQSTVATLQRAAPADLTPRPPLAAGDVRTSPGGFIVVIDEQGRVLSSTGIIDGQVPVISTEVLRQASSLQPRLAHFTVEGGLQLDAVVLTWSRPDVSISGWVVAAQPSALSQAQRLGLRRFLLWSAGFSLVVALVASWVVAGRALQPLASIRMTADAIGAASDLSRRLQPPNPHDEIGALATSFNHMLERLEVAYMQVASALDAQQRFTADASHELRTPLTTLRGNAGFLLAHPEANEADTRHALEDMVAEAARMTRLLDDLLLLARNGTGFQLPRAPARLDQITTSSLEQFGQLYPAEVVHAGPLASATVEGNEDALRRLVFILLDNVGQHARPGGQVWVRVVVESNHVCLVVADDGPGIPPADLERVFERFFQASPSRSQAGSGLGLAIARWIATDHGGTLTATNNDVGGATFTLVLPVESIAANVTATAATVAS